MEDGFVFFGSGGGFVEDEKKAVVVGRLLLCGIGVVFGGDVKYGRERGEWMGEGEMETENGGVNLGDGGRVVGEERGEGGGSVGG